MISLKATKRADRCSSIDMIPAVLYGPSIENINLEVDGKEFEKVFKSAGESLIELEVDGKKYSVMIYDTQHDPMTIGVIHADFYQPDLKHEVETEIPLELIGIAPAVSLGGTIITNLHELTVKALPKDLPAKIEVDVSGLVAFGNHIMVKDLKLPKGVTAVSHSDEVIVQIVTPANVEVELAPLVADTEVTTPEEEKKETE
ncbi:MAG: 50S ribosomal protein L25 [Candidatus Paceibacterota bacterium]|jgi:large subunit ribosomal protein L25|nr:50S ribosomal protein L25 [bacterium]